MIMMSNTSIRIETFIDVWSYIQKNRSVQKYKFVTKFLVTKP